MCVLAAQRDSVREQSGGRMCAIQIFYENMSMPNLKTKNTDKEVKCLKLPLDMTLGMITVFIHPDCRNV